MNETNEVKENEVITEEEPVLNDEVPSEEELSEAEDTEEIASEDNSEDQIIALRAEVETLRQRLEESQMMYDRHHAECMEFSELYPEVPLSSIPDSIWNSVRSGIPLAAAYALAERKEKLAKEKATEVNSKNRAYSTGALNTTKSGEYFSPAEVRAMSAAEVKANYSKIITSMSKWH